MNGLMTGDVAKAMMADRERAYAKRQRIDRVDRPRRISRLLAAVAGLLAAAKDLVTQRPAPAPRPRVRTTPEAA